VQLSLAVVAVGALVVVELAVAELRVMELIRSQQQEIQELRERDLVVEAETTVVRGES
jgi:hypothetical protein